jgi:DHA1 family bicyclomycin/chloramphenicol resistance-like MFS transporter
MRTRLILILGLLTAFGPLSVDMYLPTFPALAREFNTSAAAVQATLSAYLAGLALAQAAYGPLSDRYGRRRPLLYGLLLYIAASIACAITPSIESLWVARVVQSIGGCAGLVIARAAVRDLYHGAQAARFFSMLMLVLGTAPIIGPLLGAQLLGWFGWRSIFWALALIASGTFIAVAFGLPETLPPKRRAQGGLLQALKGYRRLLADRRFLAPTLAGDFVFAGLFAFIAGGPFVFIDLHGLRPETFALLFASNALGLMLSSQINARLVGRHGPARMLTAALLIYAIGACGLLAAALTGFGGVWGLVVPLFVLISTVGMAPANALALAQEHYPRAAGSATALFGMIQFGIGALVGILIGQIHDGSALPMAAIIAVASAASLAVNYWLTPQLKPA